MGGKRLLSLLSISFVLASRLFAQSVDDGIALFNKGRTAEAKKIFEAVLKQDDKNAEAHYRVGLVFLMNQFRNEDDAVDHMERAVELNPENADYQYGLGAAYGTKAQNAGILKQAFLAPKVKKAFEKAVQLNPKLVNAHMGLAQYYQRAPGIMGGDMTKAYSEADKIIELDELRGRAFKANLYVYDKKTSEGVGEIKTLTGHLASDWRAWRAAGLFYWRNKMAEEAIASFDKYTAMRPDTADSYHLLARAYVLKKDADKAVALAQRSLALDGSYAPAFDVLGQAYELKGQKKEARESYQRLLAMDLSEEQRKNIQKKVDELQ